MAPSLGRGPAHTVYLSRRFPVPDPVVRSLALVSALALAGCSASGPLTAGAGPETPRAEPAPSPPGLDAAERARLEALYRSRVEADLQRFVPADAAFMAGMIGHHAQALVMADMAERNGASPAVRRLAARIDNAQHDEIRTMQTWLADRGQPVPQVHVQGTVLTVTVGDAVQDDFRTPPTDDPGGMDHGSMDHGAMDHGAMDHGGMDHSGMPGMLTQAQLDELDAARGPAFDRLFLRYMIQHHAGAVTMVDDLFEADGAAQYGGTFKVASDIQVDQRTEIARMQQMLDALPAD